MHKDTIYPLLLERYALGELPPDQMQQVKVALEKNSSLREQLEAIYQSNESILNKYPKVDTIRAIDLKIHAHKTHRAISKQQQVTPRWYHYKWVYLTAVTCCLLMAVPSILYINRSQFQFDSTLHVKGLQSHLNIYRKTVQKPGAEQLKNFDKVHKGDLLQVAYVSEGKLYGTIVSLDGNGNVTLHYPDSLSGSSRLESGGEKLLSRAYELDNAPGFEHFFFVTAKDSFDVSLVVNAVKKFSEHLETAAKGTILKLPRNCKQYELILRKDAL